MLNYLVHILYLCAAAFTITHAPSNFIMVYNNILLMHAVQSGFSNACLVKFLLKYPVTVPVFYYL